MAKVLIQLLSKKYWKNLTERLQFSAQGVWNVYSVS